MKYFKFIYPHPDDNTWLLVFAKQNPFGYPTIRGVSDIKHLEKSSLNFTKDYLMKNYDFMLKKIHELENVKRGERDWVSTIVKMKNDLSQFEYQEW